MTSTNIIVLYGLVGFLFIVLALPLIAKWIRPNRWYGFRVRKTLSDAQIWYKANQTAGYGLLVAGLTIVGASAITYQIQQHSSSFPGRIFILAVFIVALSASVAHSFWALERIDK